MYIWDIAEVIISYNLYKPQVAKFDCVGNWVDIPEQPGQYYTTPPSSPKTFFDIEADTYGNLYLALLKGDQWNNHVSVIKLDIATGIPETQNVDYMIYPNLTSGIIKIKIQPDEDVLRVLVSNISGKIVFQEDNGNSVIDLSILENGVYFVNISTSKDNYIEKSDYPISFAL
jgi:hypothetical protein